MIEDFKCGQCTRMIKDSDHVGSFLCKATRERGDIPTFPTGVPLISCPYSDALDHSGFVKCKGCGKEIVWLKTLRGKNIPVDAETFHGEKLFEIASHVAHFRTCPKAKDFRKPK